MNLKTMNKLPDVKILRGMRIFFMTLAVMGIIVGSLGIATSNIPSNHSIAMIALAALLLAYANRCDTLIMKSKINQWINNQLIEGEPVKNG